MKATIIPTNCFVVDSQKVGPVAAPQLINWSSWNVKNKKSESVYLKSMSHCTPNQAIEQSSWKVKVKKKVRESWHLTSRSHCTPNQAIEQRSWIVKVDIWKATATSPPKRDIEQSSWKVKVKNKKSESGYLKSRSYCTPSPPSKPLSKVVEKWPESKCAKVTDPASNLTNFRLLLLCHQTTQLKFLIWTESIKLGWSHHQSPQIVMSSFQNEVPDILNWKT